MPPKQFHPRKRGVHRIACIALYRALLSKCPKIEIPAHLQRGKIHPIAEVVQKQFRRNAQYESQFLVVAALKIGYEAEELLHNAMNGDANAHAKIVSLLEGYQAQSRATRARHEIHPPPPPKKRIVPARRPDAPLVLDVLPRPLSAIKGGIRKVPNFIAANAVAFLKYTPVQSPYLSRILSDKIKTTIKRHALMNRMEMEGAARGSLAARENEWDAKLEGGEEDAGSAGWREVFRMAARRESAAIERDARRSQEVADRLTGILLEEKRLAAGEAKVRAYEKGKEERKRRTEEERRSRNEAWAKLPPAERQEARLKFRAELQWQKEAYEAQKLARQEAAQAPSGTPSRRKRQEMRERMARTAAAADGISVQEWKLREMERSVAEEERESAGEMETMERGRGGVLKPSTREELYAPREVVWRGRRPIDLSALMEVAGEEGWGAGAGAGEGGGEWAKPLGGRETLGGRGQGEGIEGFQIPKLAPREKRVHRERDLEGPATYSRSDGAAYVRKEGGRGRRSAEFVLGEERENVDGFQMRKAERGVRDMDISGGMERGGEREGGDVALVRKVPLGGERGEVDPEMEMAGRRRRRRDFVLFEERDGLQIRGGGR